MAVAQSVLLFVLCNNKKLRSNNRRDSGWKKPHPPPTRNRSLWRQNLLIHKIRMNSRRQYERPSKSAVKKKFYASLQNPRTKTRITLEFAKAVDEVCATLLVDMGGILIFRRQLKRRSKRRRLQRGLPQPPPFKWQQGESKTTPDYSKCCVLIENTRQYE